MSTTALVILAPGFEEIEAVTVIDVLRRAAFEVTVAGTVPGPIPAARQTRHLADVDIDVVKDRSFDVVVLPGGNEGTANLKKDARVLEIIDRQKKAGRWTAAICAAPTILHAHGWLEANHRVTCHPSVQDQIPPRQLVPAARVVVSDRLITSLAAGSAMEFAYAIVEQLLGKEAVEKVNQGVVAPLLPPQKAVFLDRDGVLNASVVRDDKPYPPQTLDEFVLLPGVIEACSRLKGAGYRLVVVTNQPDVGRGAQSREMVEAMHKRLAEWLPIDRIEVCYDAKDGESARRKPGVGMALEAARLLNIDLSRSFLVGDRWRDIDCGFNAGCRTIFIDHGYAEELRRAPDFVVKDLSAAAAIILG